MSRKVETRITVKVLRAELALCSQLYNFAAAVSGLAELSPKWRRRIKCFCGDGVIRLIQDLEEDIALLELEQEVFGDEA